MKTFVARNKHTSLIHPGLSVYYNDYTKRRQVPKKYRCDRFELMKICMLILAEVGKQIVEAKAGVLIKNFGYFFVWKIPVKATYGEHYPDHQEKYNHHTDNHKYTPVFFPAGGYNSLKFWNMDYKFCDGVKQGINKKLRSGFTYKMYPFSAKKLINL